MFPWYKSKRAKPAVPNEVYDYSDHSFKLQDVLIMDTTFVVLDCETTDLGKKAGLITLGALKCTSSEIKLSEILDQKYSFGKINKSAEIHGELHKKTGVTNEKLFLTFLDFLENHVIVGHNVAFDVQVINRKLKEAFGITLKNQVLDTARLSIRLNPEKYERQVGGQSNLHLDDLCKSYNIPIQN